MAKRWLAAWFPNWPIQRRRAGRPELEGRPLALYRGGAGTQRPVAAACKLARGRGVSVGMPLAEALALAGDPGGHPEIAGQAPRHALHAEPHEPAADRLALRRLARRCHRLTPVVALDEAAEPDALLLDIAGCAFAAGGEDRLAERLHARLARQGWGVRVGGADTAWAAWAAARWLATDATPCLLPPGETAALVRPLPVAALRPDDAQRGLLAALGLGTVGLVADLPRDTLAARFGDGFVRRLGALLGRGEEARAAEPQAVPIRAAIHWEAPCADFGALANARAALLRTALARLPTGYGLTHVELLGKDDAGGRSKLAVAAARPTAEPRRWEELLRLRLERTPPRPAGNGFVELRLRAAAETLHGPRQGDLFAAPEDDPAAWERLLERLSNRLGPERLRRPVAGHDPQPEHAGTSAAWSDPPAGLVPPPGPRPLALRPHPQALAVRTDAAGLPEELRLAGGWLRVARRDGPERIETGWWRGPSARRDYFRVQTADGRWLWLFQEQPAGRWLLHGTFD